MEFLHASLSRMYFNYFNGRVILRRRLCNEYANCKREPFSSIIDNSFNDTSRVRMRLSLSSDRSSSFISILFIIINATRAIKNRKQNWTASQRLLALKNCTWNVNRLLACQIWLKRLDKVKLSSVTCIDWLMNVLFAVVVVVVYLTHFTLSPLARISSISVISV